MYDFCRTTLFLLVSIPFYIVQVITLQYDNNFIVISGLTRPPSYGGDSFRLWLQKLFNRLIKILNIFLHFLRLVRFLVKSFVLFTRKGLKLWLVIRWLLLSHHDKYFYLYIYLLYLVIRSFYVNTDWRKTVTVSLLGYPFLIRKLFTVIPLVYKWYFLTSK